MSGYEMPKAIEEKSNSYVAYGEDNNYYSFLINNYLSSATNNAAIRSISDLIYGRGISIKDRDSESEEVDSLRSIIGHRCLKKIVQERKMLGQAAMQVIYNKAGNKRQVVKIKHFPIHTLRPEKMNQDGVVMNYYYHPDWYNKKPSDVLKKIPTFGNSTEKIELFILKPYVSGYSYFSPVDYSGSIPYAELESEISDYLLNEAKNSFSGTKVINFNNGVPDFKQRDEITRDVKGKLTGSRGQKVIIAFNDSADNKATVEDISLNDAPSHYEYLANEAMHKILVGHRVTSPMLLGIKDGGNGLASNADEIMMASQLFNSTVISTYQDEITDSLEEILEVNGKAPDLFFITSQPIEFTEKDQDQKEDINEVGKNEAIDKAKDVSEKEENYNKKEQNLSSNFNAEDQLNWLTHLNKKGEIINEDEWELVHSMIDDNEDESEDWETFLNSDDEIKLSAAPEDKRAGNSIQDTNFIKVRYAYVQGSKKNGVSQKHRPFCQAMESASRLYRKEDIIKMQSDGVNSSLGHKGQPYSIWLHKGGVNCYHKFERRIYLKKTKKDGTAWGGNSMNGVKKISVAIAKKLSNFDPKRGKWKNDKRVAEAQIDRSDRGHHPNYVSGNKKKK